ncbi:Aminoacylase [Rhynchospora pubera]|uniref:N-acyl-aliphatic-L-amino acid amidohydrolase n=1 Tax=Rhynchospora pubera TaxID=906938 RepID=A0AAV8CFF5_9POAL|nr:Aminoacylase [Rhynchospora pubera]
MSLPSSSHLTRSFLLSLLFTSIAASASAFSDDEEVQIHHFQQYLRIRTAHPDPDYSAAASFLLSLAHSIGLQTLTLEFSPNKPLLLLTWPGSEPSLPSILLNSHIDSVPAEPDKWVHPPFSATRDPHTGRIYARGAQDDKCLAIQYLEAIRSLKRSGFSPLRSVHISLVPDEEIGGADGAEKFARSEEFRKLNVGLVLDEGQASPTDEFRIFYADRSPWRLFVKATGSPGHGSRMYDGTAIEKLMDCAEAIARFRDSQFDMVKAGISPASEVISINPVYMKAGTPSPSGFVMNVQPSEAEMGFDLRLPPTVDPEQLKERINNEWVPSFKNMSYKLLQKGPIKDCNGKFLITLTNESNPWWPVFEKAVISSGKKLAKPEILSSTTDARFMREMGIPTFGFSPMANTPILLHDHNEGWLRPAQSWASKEEFSGEGGMSIESVRTAIARSCAKVGSWIGKFSTVAVYGYNTCEPE